MVRLKSRYLLMVVKFEDGQVDESLSSSALYHSIMQLIQNTYGDYGYSCVRLSFKVKSVNPYTGVVFIKCSRNYFRMVWHSITFLKEVNRRQCSMHTLHLSGTISSCQKFLIKHNKKQLQKMLTQCKTPAEKGKILKMLKELPSAESLLKEKKKRQGDLALKYLTYR